MYQLQSRFDNNRLVRNREVRLFLSSTFIDLDEERTALMKVFKSIQFEALKRNVFFNVVDLRWGITEDESRRGKVLSVCLNEIENSHPFFIGILGNRYGFAPTEEELNKNPDLIERYPWIREDIKEGRSITEIEIQYGALRQKEDTYALFFLKENVGADDNPKLTLLKKKILGQNKYQVSYFHSIEDLCNKVETAVNSIIDKCFPHDQESDSRSDFQFQESYLNELTRFYIKKPNDFIVLDNFVEKEGGKYMIISSESGVGKSALLANWILEKRKSGLFILPNFIGYSASENSKEKVLLWLYDGLCDILNIKSEKNRIVVQKEEVEKLMAIASTRGMKVVFVMDAINQLNELDHDSLFTWFPNVTPGIKVVISTEESDSIVKVFARKKLPVYHLGPLGLSDRRDFIVSYLSIYGKKLNNEQIERILSDPQNENTQILKTLLNELISFGSYAHLDNRIGYYLSANSYGDFYNRVLERVEKEYSGDQDLAKRTLSQIYLSKEGLSESEIIEMNHFREIDWRLFYCSFYNFFISRKGLLTFSDKMMAQAVCQRYHLDNSSDVFEHRELILEYFQHKPDNKRKTLELTYQNCKLDNVEELYTIVLDFLAFQQLYENDSGLLAECWRKMLDSNKGYSLLDYLQVPHNGIHETDLPLYQIGDFINMYFPNVSQQFKYYEAYLSIEPETFFKDHKDLATAVYSDIADCYSRIGDFESALKLYNFLLDHINDSVKKADIYLLMGNIFDYKGEFKKAINYYKLVLNSSDTIDPWTLASGYNGLAGVFKNMGMYQLSLEYYLKAKLLLEEYYGESTAEMVCNTGIGYVYGKMHKPKEALEYLEKALNQMSDYYGETHPSCFFIIENMAGVYLNNGDFENGLKTLLHIIETFESANFNYKNWSKVYGDVGQLYYQKGDFVQAVDYYQRAIEKESEMGIESDRLADLYYRTGSSFFQLGDYQQTADYFEKSAIIYEKTKGLKNNQMISLYKTIGILYKSTNNMEKALEHYENALVCYYTQLLSNTSKQEIPVYEEPENDEKIKDVIGVLRGYPEILERGFQKIVDQFEEAHPFAIVASKCVGSAYFDQHNYDKALERIQHIIYLIDNYFPNSDLILKDSCYHAAILCQILKKPNEAVKYYQRAFDLIKGNTKDDTEKKIKLLGLIGSQYLDLEDYVHALSSYESTIELFKEKNLAPDFDTLLSMGIAYDHLGNLDASIDYYKRAFEVVGEIIDQKKYALYKIQILAKIGSLYYKKKELHISHEYFLKAANCYDRNEPDESQTIDAINSSASAAKIAIDLAKEAVETKSGYDEALKRLKDSYESIIVIMGPTTPDSLKLKTWIQAIEKIRNDSLPWYRKLFHK